MSVKVVSLFSQVLRVYLLVIFGTKILVVGQGCFIINCIVFQRFLHKGEKLECDMILLYGYFEGKIID